VITDFLLAVVLRPLAWVVGLFPAFETPGLAGVDGHATWLGAQLRRGDRWIDVELVVAAVVWLSVLVGAVVVIRGVLFVYRLVPGKAA
jgi:hypothetical protein